MGSVGNAALYRNAQKNAMTTKVPANPVELPGNRRYIHRMSEHGHHHHDHHHGSALRSELTPGRKRILDVLEGAGHPLGAYEMIDLLAARTGKRPAPISIYRALDFLVEAGLVHRLASRNAFLACGHSHKASEAVAFLICDSCGVVAETSSAPVRSSLDAVATEAGFSPRSRVIEVTGTCAACKAA